MEIKRGQIWYASFNDSVGSELGAGRPCVIVSNERGCETSPVLNVVFLTTSPSTKANAVHVSMTSSKRRSHALCEQVTTLDKSRLNSYIADAFPEEMERIDTALAVALGLEPDKTEYEAKLEEADEAWYSWKTEADTYKRLYEKALEKLVEAREQPKPQPEKVAKTQPKKPEKVQKPKKEIVLPVVVESKPEKLNLNTARYTDMKNFGINKMYASKITAYRREHGTIESVDDLYLAELVGEEWFDKWKDKLEV